MKKEINLSFKLNDLSCNSLKTDFLKGLYIVLIMSVCIGFSSAPGYSQDGGVGINTLEPDTSAVLDIVASRKGLLIPRLEQGVVDTGIALPANGLMIFNTTTNTFQFNSGTPSSPSWGDIGGGSISWATGGNTGTSPSTNFIGTGDNADLSIQVDSTEMIRITTSGFVGIANSSPVAALDVGGGIKVGFTANANEGTLRWTGSDLEVVDSQGVWRSLTSGGADNDWTVSGNYVYNQSDSIGIGTTAPRYLLNVVGGGNAITGSSVDVSELSTVLRRSDNTSSNALGIGFGHTSNTTSVGAAIIHERNGSQSQGSLHFATKASTSVGADIPIRMTITKDGDVLIGDQFSKEGKKFEITGSAYVVDTLFAPKVSGLGAFLDIQTNGTSRMRISDASGNVGIGTTSPAKHLHIVGGATKGSVLVAPSETVSGDSSEVILAEDGMNDYGMSIVYDGATNNLLIFGKQQSTTFGPHLEIERNTGNTTINGDLNITGNLSKGGGSFKIDHPLDPANKYLIHSFVESADMMNIYNGNANLDANGEAIVTLPSYCETVNMDFKYQLTPVGASMPNLYIAAEMSGNNFKIAGGAAGQKVSWQVTGVRSDPWANAHRIETEVNKEAHEKGMYLHPDLYGMPKEKNLKHARKVAEGN